MPDGTAMGVALRRSLRVGRHAGEPLEDVGVMPEIVRPLTATDLLEGNTDLINFACGVLAGKPSYRLDIREIHGRIPAPDRKHLKLRLTVTTRGVTRLEVHIQDRPQIAVSVPIEETITTLEVPLSAECVPFKLELKGFVFVGGEVGRGGISKTETNDGGPADPSGRRRRHGRLTSETGSNKEAQRISVTLRACRFRGPGFRESREDVLDRSLNAPAIGSFRAEAGLCGIVSREPIGKMRR